MALLDRITGFSKYEQELEPRLLSKTLESLRVRVDQSHKALWLVSATALVYMVMLWGETASVPLLVWFGLIVLLALVRVWISLYVARNIQSATVSMLYRNEILLFLSSLISAIVVGSGYWWIGIGNGDRVVFAITLLVLIYAIGTTVNTSIHFRGFPLLLVALIGQGILFLSFFRSPADPEASVAMLAIMILLVQYGKRNASVFEESIRIRDESRAQNVKLEKDKLIIEKALNVARKANEEKNRFMAAASHDLRQPLHAMTLFLGSLRHMAGDARARELIDKIDDTSSLLHEQFNSLLDLSKFDAGVVTADEVEFRLDTLLKNIVDGVSPEAHQKKLTIQLYSPAVTIRSDMLLIERMIRNLIVNAVRYTDKGSVNVQVRRKRSGLVISIVDTGIGIATEDQQKIFRDYYQIRNRARSKGKGSGLGLAIVKRIAALLDFKVNLKSTPDTGSTFNIFVPARVLLDVSESGVEKQSGIEADSTALEGIHILVVDDDPVNLDAMTGLLRTWGCHAVGASTPEQVERLLAHDNSFDLVLMDDMLHDEISGFDIARNLEATLSPGRVIMVTGNVSAVRMFEIRDAGFELLTKPVDYYVLRKALVDALAE
jgi:signal transduction histidine kinase/CheY-like chemotaxis protein